MIPENRNIPTFTISKSKREAKILDKDLVKFENFGIHSPDVGVYDPPNSTLSGPKFSMSKFQKYHSPKHKTELIKHYPHAYASIYTDRQVGPKNYSYSSLPKQQRFRFRDLFELECVNLPSPSNYNLSQIKSIGNRVQADLLTKLKQKRMSKFSLSYSRFKDSVFYHEKERLMKGNDSVSPTIYDSLAAYKALQSNKNGKVSFTKEKREFIINKEDKESPSPTKYNAIIESDINPARIKKGVSIGKSKRQFDFKVPTF